MGNVCCAESTVAAAPTGATNRVHPAPDGPAAKGTPAGPQDEPDIIIDSPAPIPSCNASRLKTLHDLRMSSSNKGPMEHVDHIIHMVMSVFEVPSAWITILGDEESCVRNCGGDMQPGTFPWAPTICGWTLATPMPTVLAIPDTLQDARFAKSFLTIKMGVRSYCGAPLVASNGHRMGTLCLVDTKPRQWSPHLCQILSNFAELAIRAIERAAVMGGGGNALTTAAAAAAAAAGGGGSAAEERLQPHLHFALRSIEALDASVVVVDTRTPGLPLLYANPAAAALLGADSEKMKQQHLTQLLQSVEGGREQQWRQRTQAHQRWEERQVPCVGTRDADGAPLLLRLAFSPVDEGPLDPAAPGVAAPLQAGPADSSRAPLGPSPFYFVSLAPDSSPAAAEAQAGGAGAGAGGERLPEGLQLGPAIAFGAYGRAYAARWHGAKVAVKLLDTLLNSSSSGGEGLRKKALLGAHLKHPHLVTILDCAPVTDQAVFGVPTGAAAARTGAQQTLLVLEFCDSGNLQNAMDCGWFRAQRLPGAAIHVPAVATTASEIAAGLHHLQQQGLVHGSLSPYSVLLASSGAAAATAGRGFTAKLVDAGLASMLGSSSSSSSATQEMAGAGDAYACFAYVAPELLEGSSSGSGSGTAAADVYSFGVLLWQMYTGERPWAGLGRGEVVQRVVVGKEALPVPAGMPQRLADLVAACCAWQPAGRPSFQEVLEVLRPLAEKA